MKSLSPLRLLTSASENLLKNWMTVLPTIVVMATSLTLFHGLIAVHNRAEETLAGIQQKFSITVYLKNDTDSFAVANLITKLEARRDVITPVKYTSKEEAWKLLQKTFTLDNELLKKYQFSLPPSLTITPRSPSDTQAIQIFLNDNAKNLLRDEQTGMTKNKNITNQMVEFIQRVRDSALKGLVLFIVLFVIGAALLTSAVIHLAITTRRGEIMIMKLVGASQQTIMLPFVLEGFLMSIVAFALHLLLLALLSFEVIATTLMQNALVLELLGIMLLSVVVSAITTFLHIKRWR